jgi:5'-nucleotidase (lipoprotein e(P4) family)
LWREFGAAAFFYTERSRGALKQGATVCPSNEAALRAVSVRGRYPDRAAHPLRRLIAAAVRVTLNSDDPPFFRTALGAAYDRAAWERPNSAASSVVRRRGDQTEAIEGGQTMIGRRALLPGALLATVPMGVARAQAGPPPSDLPLATLWTQRSVEYKGNALTVYALGRYRLEEALADKNWTAAPAEQKGNYQNLPPAVVLDIDETVLDNSHYQVWMMKNNQTFSLKTWNQFCAGQASLAIPGAVEFTKQAAAKDMKVFYISNRGIETKKDTRENLEKLGFPMGGNVDTVLAQSEKPEWGSQKGTRRAAIAKDYRILLNFGDQFGDFDDRYRTSEAERLKAFEENKARWGREWLVIGNPTYGSFDTAPYSHDFKKPLTEQRQAKWDVLEGWSGPKQ